MISKLLTIFLTLCLLATTSTFAAKPTAPTQTTPRKQKLVLIPIVLSNDELKLRGQIETSLVSGLQERYAVFSGENVLQKHREIMTKESKESKGLCDETKCMQDLAEGFGSELVAVVHITKEEGGFLKAGKYILSINVQNIFDNKAVYNDVLYTKNTDSAELLDKLKELGRGDTVFSKTPEVITPPVKEEKPIQPTKADAENEIWNEAQKRNTVDDYQVYIDSYPKGKYTGFAKTSIKKLKLEQAPKVEPAALTPQKVQVTASAKTTNSKDVFYDKSTGLTWQDNEEAKTAEKDWQGAKDYCENLTLAGRSDWRLPTKDELLALHPKRESLKNVALDIYWFFSEDVSGSARSWGVNFRSGGTFMYTASNSYYVRCVRGSK